MGRRGSVGSRLLQLQAAGLGQAGEQDAAQDGRGADQDGGAREAVQGVGEQAERDQAGHRAEDPGGDQPAGGGGPGGGREQLGAEGAERRGVGRGDQDGQQVAGGDRGPRPVVGEHAGQGDQRLGAGGGDPAAQPVGGPAPEQQPDQADRGRGQDHGGGGGAGHPEGVLGVDEQEGVHRAGDEGDREGQDGQQPQPGAQVGPDPAQDGRSGGGQARVLGGPEPLVAVGLLQPAGEQGRGRQGDEGEGEQAAEPQPVAGHPPDQRGQAGADAVAGGQQADRLGPVAAVGLLGGDHAGDGVGGREHRPAQGEQGHEPPVAGAQGGQGGDGQAAGHAGQQQPPAAVAVGQGGQGQAGQRGQADDGQADPQGGAGEPDPGHHRGAVAGLAEGVGHVAEGGGGAELGEAGGHGGRGHGQDRRVAPAMQPDPAAGGGVRPGVARWRRPGRAGRGHVPDRPGGRLAIKAL